MSTHAPLLCLYLEFRLTATIGASHRHSKPWKNLKKLVKNLQKLHPHSHSLEQLRLLFAKVNKNIPVLFKIDPFPMYPTVQGRHPPPATSLSRLPKTACSGCLHDLKNYTMSVKVFWKKHLVCSQGWCYRSIVAMVTFIRRGSHHLTMKERKHIGHSD